MKRRLHWVDSLRGILILLVVLGHAIQFVLGKACYGSHIWNAIYSFHMAAFMAVSGWLGYHAGYISRYESRWLSTIWRRAQQLLIPFLLWSFVKVVLYQSISIQNISGILLYPDRYFWFLWVLFWIHLFFVWGDWISTRSHIKQEVIVFGMSALFALLMLITEYRLFGFQFFAYYFFFYIFGYYLHKYKERLITNNRFVLSILMLVWTILAWFWRMDKMPEFLSFIPLPHAICHYAYRFITAVIAVYLLLCISPKLLNAHHSVIKPFLWMGKVSLGIYVIHLLIIGIISRIVGVYVTIVWADVLVVFSIALLVSCIIVWILGKWKWTARLLLGKV